MEPPKEEPLFFVKPELYNILQTMGLEKKITHFEEIKQSLIKYIHRKRLSTIERPMEVRVKGDPLYDLIPSKKDVVYREDILMMLKTQLAVMDKTSGFPVPLPMLRPAGSLPMRPAQAAAASSSRLDQPSSSGTNAASETKDGPSLESVPGSSLNAVGKRKLADGQENGASPDSKRLCPLSAGDYVYSTTDYSSDTTWESDQDKKLEERLWESGDVVYPEYEVVTEESSFSCSGSDSDSDHELLAQIVLCQDDCDVEFFADVEFLGDDDSSSDREMSDADKWKCKRCGGMNKPPSRFCGMCWDQRDSWLPEGENQTFSASSPKIPLKKSRTKRKKSLKKAKQLRRSLSLAQLSSSQTLSLGSSLPEDRLSSSDVDAPVVLLPGHVCPERDQSALWSHACHICSQRECPMCMKPKTLVNLNHGSTAHVYCCYKCAKWLVRKRKPCPICKARIESVTRAYAADF